MNKHLFSSMLITFTLVGCASSSQETANIESSQLNTAPAWVLMPSSANGFAASNCVETSGNFSIDRNHAIALSRNTLAQNLDVKVSVLEKTYQQLNKSPDGSNTGSTFEQIAKQISNTSIQKSQVEQIALVTISGKEQVCALVVMPKTESEKILDQAMGSGGAINPDDKSAMYKEFLSQKSAKELQLQVQDL